MSSSYPFTPYKRQKHPHYEHQTEKLDRNNNQFRIKKFHHVRNVSTHKKILKSFGRIGTCLNDKSPICIPKDELTKVCFITINDYYNEPKDLGVGPLNDGYLVGLKHLRLGYKIFYLYNSLPLKFTNYLSYFMKNTTEKLSIFYSGRDDDGEGIEFSDGTLSMKAINDIISSRSNGKSVIVFLADTYSGGQMFNIKEGEKMLTFYTNKRSSGESKENKRLHGICTYYFCKILSNNPNITPDELVEKMNFSLRRFNIIFKCDVSTRELQHKSILN